MELVDDEFQQSPELVPLNVIRVETALSRYPVHRLAKQGTVAIEIREKTSDGESVIRWEVSHNSKFGQPGPLAYKLDTLIVNRKIEEATRPIPRIICLGTLSGLAEQLGLGGDTNKVKIALRQNAFTGIIAKFRYRSNDGIERDFEADFTRYNVIFTGEKLPDGRRADAVYLELSERFMQVINGAQTRPLDYDYLKDLPPASQRLYELLSFHMYGALKYGKRSAKLRYADFCTHAPLTRFAKWDQVRPQMARIHRPHLASGYIDSVEFEQTADQDGKPDWFMMYVPGAKARAEFRAFNKKGGPKTLEIEQSPPTLENLSRQVVEPSPLEQELIARGVTPSTAQELVAEFPTGRITAQVELFDWLKGKTPSAIKKPGGWLTKAIRKGDFNPPEGFITKAERAKRQEQEEATQQAKKLAEQAKLNQEAAQQEARERAFTEFWESLDDAQREEFEAKAIENGPPWWLKRYRQLEDLGDKDGPAAKSLVKAMLYHRFESQQNPIG